MEETDTTEPDVILSQNQTTCVVVALPSVCPSHRNRDASLRFASLHVWHRNLLRCAITSGEKCGQASNQRPCSRTQHSDHRCDDELKRPQIVRGGVFRGINSNPREYRSGHGSTYSKNHRQEAGFTDCAGGSSKHTDNN